MIARALILLLFVTAAARAAEKVVPYARFLKW